MGTHLVQRVSFETGTFVSDPASADLFGANVLLGRDDLSGTFHSKTAGWNLSVLRYPGGGLTEDYFDPANPDAQIVTPVAGHVGLSDFLAYCALHGHRPAIVLPTKRYLSDPAGGEQEIRDFVAAVTRGDFGPVTDPIFQIGNEYYASTVLHGPIATAEYAAIASRLAVAVAQEALTPASVIVQTGRYAADNATIIAAFDTAAERAAVDGVSFHQYPWQFGAVAGRFATVGVHLAQWEDAGIGGMAFMSEWNVGSSTDDSTDYLHDYGQAQNGVFLEIVYNSILAGIDVAAVWGVQQNNKTSLTANEGNGSIYSAGAFYAQMAADLPGMQAVGHAELAQGTLHAYAFEDVSRVSVYIHGRDMALGGGPMQLDVDLDGLFAGFTDVTATSFSTLDTPTTPRPTPDVTSYAPQIIVDDGEPMVRVWLTQDYQTIHLQFTKQSAINLGAARNGGLSGDVLTGGAGGDTIRGHDGADYIFAHDGDDEARGGRMADELRGGAGFDTMIGGSAHDALYGGADGDVLEGRSGSDRLYGGEGDDTIDGGSGRDFLYGGSGDDWLTGGAGNDRFWGGEGADVFVFEDGMALERVHDFAPGTDLVDLSAVSGVSGYGDLGFRDWFGHLEVLTPQGVIRLRFVSEEEIGPSDFLF